MYIPDLTKTRNFVCLITFLFYYERLSSYTHIYTSTYIWLLLSNYLFFCVIRNKSRMCNSNPVYVIDNFWHHLHHLNVRWSTILDLNLNFVVVFVGKDPKSLRCSYTKEYKTKINLIIIKEQKQFYTCVTLQNYHIGI